MDHELGYSAVKKFLEEYSTKEPPYDFNGLLHLVLAGIENLRKNSLDHELLDYAHSVSPEQAEFLRRLLEIRPQSIAQFGE